MKKLKDQHSAKSGHELALTCAQAGSDAKAEDILILDVRGLASFTDYFVIMNGRSTRHVQGIAEAVEKELSNKRIKSSHAEGLQEGQWVLLDFDDVIVHVFYHEQRAFYNLEGLWHDAPRVALETVSEP